MTGAQRIQVDATPGAHDSGDALAVVSFRFACGWGTRMTAVKDAGKPHTELGRRGMRVPVLEARGPSDHCATYRLAGGSEPLPEIKLIRESLRRTRAIKS